MTDTYVESYDYYRWDVVTLPIGAPAFDDPGKCETCGERVGAWVVGDCDQSMDCTPFWIIGEHLVCDECYADTEQAAHLR
ncbi:MAG: hypothetical protein RLZZ01_263 [Actinomycetota bacterium]|jgi:hypothetical protein